MRARPPGATGGSDAGLLRAARRDPEAFRTFYRAHAEWVYRWLVPRTGDPELASDLTAETFAQALVSLPSFKGTEPGSGTAWVFGIARNLLRRTYERRRLETSARRRLGMQVRAGVADDLAEVDDRLDAAALRDELAAAIGEIPPALREVLEMRVVGELSYREIAAATGLTEPNARMQVSRALRAVARRVVAKEET